jgi:hypothetical protein
MMMIINPGELPPHWHAPRGLGIPQLDANHADTARPLHGSVTHHPARGVKRRN